jgi:hypothetical protein
MSDLRAKLAERQKSNPSNEPSKLKDGSQRIPMSVPRQRLAVPEISGYHTHWMRGTPDRIAQARQAGYEFVDQDEVGLANFGLADGGEATVGTDMGSRVSVIAGGGDTDHGQATRLYLMKIREEWWMEDQEALERRSESLAQALRGEKAMDGNPHAGRSQYNERVIGRPENRNILQPRIRQRAESE